VSSDYDDQQDALRRLWEADMEYRMSLIELAEAKAILYRDIVAAYRGGWTEEEISKECNVPIGFVRAAIENRPPRRPTKKGK
jgi:hypothetical protein